MKARILPNGLLKITANNLDRRDLRNCYDSGGYFSAQDMVAEGLHRQNFSFVRPEWIAALTDAPIITDDLCIGDDGTAEYVGDVWWFPGHALDDPWEQLKNRGYVIFEPEENNKSLPKEAAA